MKTSLLSLFAGTAFLAGAAGASAGEPVTLASPELDAITAGGSMTAKFSGGLVPNVQSRQSVPTNTANWGGETIQIF